MNNQKVGIKERFFNAKSKEEVVVLVAEFNAMLEKNKGGYNLPSSKTIRYCHRIANKWGVK